jgi:hypothetical protein
MALTDSAVDPAAVARARELLAPRPPKDSSWHALAAAGFCAVCALAFAVSMILAPPATTTHLVNEEDSVTLSMTPPAK